MTKLPHEPPAPAGRTNLASCAVATTFLISLVIIISVLFFTLFKPMNPNLSVTAVQLPTFSISNNTVTFTFSLSVAVRNPNRALFTHYDSNVKLLFSGTQVGFMFIPAGKIDAGRTQYMAATFSVQSFPLGAPVTATVVPIFPAGVDKEYGIGPTMEIESRMEMTGRVRVMHFFSHHVEARASCEAAVSIGAGSVLGFHC